MVMSKLTKECFLCIKKTSRRFLSIFAIVLLGVGFYAGIKATSPDMKKTLNTYYEDTNFYDLYLTSNYGIEKDIVSKLKNEGYSAFGNYSFDEIIKKKEEYAVKVLSYDKDANINKLVVKEGRLPRNNNECVIESSDVTKNFQLGEEIEIDDTILNTRKLKIVGFVQSPLYISRERDSTKLLSGKINFYMYTPITNFNSDVYTNLYIDLKTSNDVFSDMYWEQIKKEKKKIKKLTRTFESKKYQEVLNTATTKLNTAKKEYEQQELEVNTLLANSFVPEEKKSNKK